MKPNMNVVSGNSMHPWSWELAKAPKGEEGRNYSY